MKTDIKNESVDVGTLAGCQSPTKMYDFDNGAVRLEYRDGRYHVLLNGVEQAYRYSAVQMANPRIAIMLYTSCIDSYLSEKVGEYLLSRGYNRIMGCKVNMMCNDCRSLGLDTADNLCRCFTGA